MTYPYSPDVLRLNPPLAGSNCSIISNSSTGRKPALPHESEADFLTWVVAFARLKGWRVAHFRPARTIKNGEVTWRTAVSADGAGFFDLVLVRDGRVIFAELKSEKGKLSNDQYKWFEALGRSPIENFLWRPSDRNAIMKLLE